MTPKCYNRGASPMTGWMTLAARRRHPATGFGLTLLLILSVLCFSGEAFATVVLRMNHQFPETTVGSKIDQWFASEVLAATQGAVDIHIYWSNRLGDPRDNLSLLQRGDIDMAAMSAGYFPDALPLFAAPNAIPMGMDDICQASAIMKAVVDKIPALEQEAAASGVRPLFFHTLNPYLLVSTAPITSFSQLSGKRIRAWGNDLPRLISSAGATPVTLFLPDVYNALKHGVIDACPFSVDLAVSYQIHDFARHISDVVIWEGPAWGVWISLKAWDRLSPAHRQIFIDTAEKARLKELPELLAAEKSAREYLTNQGIQFHRFPEKEQQAWKAAAPDFFSEFISEMAAQGKGNAAKQMVEIWSSLRERVQCPEGTR